MLATWHPLRVRDGKQPKSKAGKRVQVLLQSQEPGLRLAEFLADSSKKGTDTGRLRKGDLEQPLELPLYQMIALSRLSVKFFCCKT